MKASLLLHLAALAHSLSAPLSRRGALAASLSAAVDDATFVARWPFDKPSDAVEYVTRAAPRGDAGAVRAAVDEFCTAQMAAASKAREELIAEGGFDGLNCMHFVDSNDLPLAADSAETCAAKLVAMAAWGRVDWRYAVCVQGDLLLQHSTQLTAF